MAQAVLELECPSCGVNLELDRGFAGGVCRCFDCGTLMTVPADPVQQVPEQLVRPDTPGGPARPESPVAPAAEDQTYTTVSGQVVRVSADTVPTARRRRTGVRVTTAIVFAIFVLMIVGACVAAVVVLMAGPSTPDAAEIVIDQFGYDPSANPYTLDTPNVLGLPIDGPTSIIVDASGSSRPWLRLVQDQLVAGLTGHVSQTPVQLIYAGEPEPVSLRDGPVPLAQIDREALIAFQDDQRARGVAPLGLAIALAVNGTPARVVLITGQTLYGADADTVVEPLRAAGAAVDVIDIGGNNDAFRALADTTGGHYVALAERDLQDWYRDR